MGIPCVDLNDFVEEFGLGEKTRKGLVVDTNALRNSLLRRIKPPCLVYGHLLPYVFRRNEVDVVVVLRCNPAVLKQRLQRRGYRGIKLRENLEAELIGVVLSSATSVFGEESVIEFDTTNKSASSVAKALARQVKRRPQIGRRIDWTVRYASPEEFTSLLSAKNTGSTLT